MVPLLPLLLALALGAGGARGEWALNGTFAEHSRSASLLAAGPPPAVCQSEATGCVYDRLVCREESTLQLCNCQYYVPCGLNPPHYTNWRDTHTCSCEPNWVGADCSIATPPPAKPSSSNPDVCGHKGKYYDGTFLNTALAKEPADANEKYVECYVKENSDNLVFGLRQHRVNVSVKHTTEDGHAQVDFVLLSRHRNTTIEHPAEPHWHQCLPQDDSLSCSMQCKGHGQPGDKDVVYTCGKANCTACPVGAPHYCSKVLATLSKVITLTTNSEAPLRLDFSNVNSAQGTADLLLNTQAVKLQLECRTGMCVGRRPVGHTPHPGKSHALVHVAYGAGGFAALVLLVVGAYLASRRPRGDPADARHVAALDGFLRGKDVVDDHTIKLGLIFSDVTFEVDASAGSCCASLRRFFCCAGGGCCRRRRGRAAEYDRLLPVTATGSGSGGGGTFGSTGGKGSPLAKAGAEGTSGGGVGGGGGPSGGGKARRKGPRRVLGGVSGHVEEGQMVAIMGPSGAGKSSLLNILADRVPGGRVGGHVHLIGGGGIIHPRRRDVVSYVLQDDHLMHTQTVEEALLFSARMRLSHDYTDTMIRAKVAQLMADLRIDHIAHSRIGHADHGGGISGGERKRVAIGVELVANPRFLLLDEPTSGLDSTSAEVVLRVLRKTAEHGCACVLTIHQPSYEVFSTLFDNVLLVSRLGRQLFYGPPLEAVAFYRDAGIPVPQFKNPAEFLLDLCAERDTDALRRVEDTYARSESRAALVGGIRDDYQRHRRLSRGLVLPGEGGNIGAIPRGGGGGGAVASDSPDAEALAAAGAYRYQQPGGAAGATPSPPPASPSPPPAEAPVLSASSSAPSSPGSGERTRLERRRMPSGMSKFGQLSGRSFRHIARDPSLLLLQVAVTVVVAALTGAIFFHVDNKLSGIQNRVGVLFFMVLFFSIMSLSSLGVLFSERVLFRRERKAGFYTTLPYYLSKLFSDMLPMRVLPPLLFAGITYWMIGLHDSAARFLVFAGTLVLVNLVCTAACFCFSAVCSSVGQANLLSSLFVIFSTVFGGLLFNTQASTHSHLGWGSMISYFFAAYEILMCNEFYGLNLIFNAKGYGAHAIPGSEIPINYGMDHLHMYDDLARLSAFFGGLVLLGYLCLRFTK